MRKFYLILLILIMILNTTVALSSENSEPKAKSINTTIEPRNIQNEKNQIRGEVVRSLRSEENVSESEVAKEGEIEEESEGEGKTEGGEEEGGPPINFPGWQVIFAFVSTVYYILALKLLPLLIENKSQSGGHH